MKWVSAVVMAMSLSACGTTQTAAEADADLGRDVQIFMLEERIKKLEDFCDLVSQQALVEAGRQKLSGVGTEGGSDE